MKRERRFDANALPAMPRIDLRRPTFAHAA